MATFDLGVLSNSVIAHKKPITLQQGRALRDNPIAIAEGAAGATRITLGALARLDIGASIKHASSKITSPREWSFPVIQGGNIRVAISDMDVGDSLTIARVRAGSSTTVHAQTGTAGNADYTVAVLPGDNVTVTITGSDGIDKWVRIKTDGTDIFPVGGDFIGNYTANTLT